MAPGRATDLKIAPRAVEEQEEGAWQVDVRVSFVLPTLPAAVGFIHLQHEEQVKSLQASPPTSRTHLGHCLRPPYVHVVSFLCQPSQIHLLCSLQPYYVICCLRPATSTLKRHLILLAIHLSYAIVTRTLSLTKQFPKRPQPPSTRFRIAAILTTTQTHDQRHIALLVRRCRSRERVVTTCSATPSVKQPSRRRRAWLLSLEGS